MKKVIAEGNDVKKIAFLNKGKHPFKKMVEVARVVEDSGKKEQQGFEQSAPSIYITTDKFDEIANEKFIQHYGCTYEQIECDHQEHIRVFCLCEIFDEAQNNCLAIEKFLSLIQE